MFRYEFLIDYENNGSLENLEDLKNVEIPNSTTYPFVGFSVVRNLNEELDSGYIEFLSNVKEEIKVFTYLKLNIYQDNETQPFETKEFYVARDSVEQISKEKSIYRHSVDVIELTKKLEKKIVDTITFTQPTQNNKVLYTLYNALCRAIRIYDTIEDDNLYHDPIRNITLPATETNDILCVFDYSTYPISDKLIISKILHTELLKKIEMPEVMFTNCTLREVLDGLFQYINAVVRVVNRYEIDFESFNMLNKLIYISGIKTEKFTQEQNVEEYATDMQTFIENQTSDRVDKVSQIVHPSNNGYDALKGSVGTYYVSDSNAVMLLEEQIYFIDKVIIKAGYAGSATATPKKVDLDISKYVVERSVYETLKSYAEINNIPSGSLAKNNTIYYDKNSRQIFCDSTFKFRLFNYSNFCFAVVCAMRDYLVENGLGLNKSVFLLNLADQSTHIGNANESYCTVVSDFPFSDVCFRVYYNSKYNIKHKVIKQDNQVVDKDTSMYYNQNAKVIALKRINQNMQSKIDRIGNYNFDLTIRHKNNIDIFKVGDAIVGDGDKVASGNYVITVAEYIYYDDFIVGKYECSKDYSRINEFIGVDSQVRYFEMPDTDKSYMRTIKTNDYAYIYDTTQPEYIAYEKTINGSYLTYLGATTILGSIANDYVSNRFEYEDLKRLYETGNNIYFAKHKLSTETIQVGTHYTETYDFTDIQKEWYDIGGSELFYEQYYNALQISGAKDGFNNILSFSFGFNDNINAGFVVKGVGGKQIMKKIPYCRGIDENLEYSGLSPLGHLRSVKYKLLNTVFTNDIQFHSTVDYTIRPELGMEYPLARYRPKTFDTITEETRYTEEFDLGKDAKLIETKDLLVIKDPREILRFNHQINIISKTPNFILGKHFAEYNDLIYSKDSNMKFYFTDKAYVDNELFSPKGDLIETLTTANNQQLAFSPTLASAFEVVDYNAIEIASSTVAGLTTYVYKTTCNKKISLRFKTTIKNLLGTNLQTSGWLAIGDKERNVLICVFKVTKNSNGTVSIPDLGLIVKKDNDNIIKKY